MLVAPAQATQESTDVRPVVGNAELAFDELGDARRDPQIGGAAMGQGALRQELLQALQLARGQLRRSSERGPDLEGLAATTPARIATAHDRAGGTVEQPSDLVERAAFAEQGEGAMASGFQQLSRTWGSWHGNSPPGGHPLLHYLCSCQQ